MLRQFYFSPGVGSYSPSVFLAITSRNFQSVCTAILPYSLQSMSVSPAAAASLMRPYILARSSSPLSSSTSSNPTHSGGTIWSTFHLHSRLKVKDVRRDSIASLYVFARELSMVKFSLPGSLQIGFSSKRLWIVVITLIVVKAGDHFGPLQVPKIDRHTFPSTYILG